MKLFEMWATLGLDTSGFEKEAKSATQQGRTLGESIQKGIGAKSVVVGNLITDVTQKTTSMLMEIAGKSIGIGADMQAEAAQFSAAFGSLAGSAETAIGSISKDINVLPSRLKAVATGGFSQLKGAGLDANEALGATENLLRLAADAAAYYDISLEDAHSRLLSFMRGNTEAGDAIGLFTSESQRNTAALDKYGQKWSDLNEAQRQMLMMSIVDDIYETSGAMGQASREADSWSNTTANLSEAWRRIVGSFGQPFLAVFTPVAERLTSFFTDNEQRVGQLGQTVADFAENAMSKAVEAFDWCIDNKERLSSMLTAAATGFVLVRFAVNPVKTSIQLVAAASIALIANWEEVLAAAERIWGRITSLISGAASAGESANAAVTEATGSNFLGNLAQTIIQNSTKNPDNLWAVGFNASGLDYVPYNNYLSYLHAGEAVLTRQEAEKWRGGSNGGGFSAEDLMAAAAGALNGAQVVMDETVVGTLITPVVSRNIARETKKKWRYATT